MTLASSCAKEVTASKEGKYLSINASMAADGQKSTLVDGGSTIYWEAGDKLSAFIGNTGYCFACANKSNSETAVFTSSEPVAYAPAFGDDETFLWALYPYDPAVSFDGTYISTTLPSEQTARAGSFSNGSNITVGKSSNFDVAFRNVCGGVRFSLTQSGVKTVTFEALGNESIAGGIKITIGNDGIPSSEAITPGKSTITLSAPAGSSFETGKWYYIDCIPCTLTKGYRLRFYIDSETTIPTMAEKTVTTPVTISRGVFGSLANVDSGLTYESASCIYGVALWDTQPSELVTVSGTTSYDGNGFNLTSAGTVVKLNRWYALAERSVRYAICPSADAVINFHTDADNTAAVVDIPNKRIYLRSSPNWTYASAPFLKGSAHYYVELIHRYRHLELKVTDMNTGEYAIVAGEEDGAGGVGKGMVKTDTFSVGICRDKYCVTLESGTSLLIRMIHVFALKNNVKLIMYGDSISQPEGYYPKETFSRAWTQQVIDALGGNAMSSGRGGGNIDTVLEYIQNELPHINADYVMVTIGTNGGNTQAKLTQLVQYIQNCGATPILNNIPCNESATQISINADIEAVRTALSIKGAKFDLATSVDGDGKVVNKSMMFWEDYDDYPDPYTGWQIYHHPNELGSDAMFQQIQKDLPELFQ